MIFVLIEVGGFVFKEDFHVLIDIEKDFKI